VIGFCCAYRTHCCALFSFRNTLRAEPTHLYKNPTGFASFLSLERNRFLAQTRIYSEDGQENEDDDDSNSDSDDATKVRKNTHLLYGNIVIVPLSHTKWDIYCRMMFPEICFSGSGMLDFGLLKSDRFAGVSCSGGRVVGGQDMLGRYGAEHTARQRSAAKEHLASNFPRPDGGKLSTRLHLEAFFHGSQGNDRFESER